MNKNAVLIRKVLRCTVFLPVVLLGFLFYGLSWVVSGDEFFYDLACEILFDKDKEE